MTIGRVVAVGLGLAVLCTGASASQLVFHPTNPTFGGNPLNGSFLLSTAQAQGKGAKSGQNSPDLSGLNDALSNLGNNVGGSSSPVIVIGGPGGTTIPTNP